MAAPSQVSTRISILYLHEHEVIIVQHRVNLRTKIQAPSLRAQILIAVPLNFWCQTWLVLAYLPQPLGGARSSAKHASLGTILCGVAQAK